VIFISFRITIKSLSGSLLTYRNVESYSIDEGMITFKNSVDGSVKSFSVQNSEISEEVKNA